MEKLIGHRLIIHWENDTRSSKYRHKYGGIPSNEASLPLCPGCEEPHHLLFQIDLEDPDLAYLALPELDYLFFFTCLNCASYEQVMYYRLTNQGQEISVLQQSPGRYVAEYPTPLPDRGVSRRSLGDDEYPTTKENERRLLSQEGKHQLGGMPLWQQDVEHICCLECGKGMEYAAMVDTELLIGKDGFRERGHMFGDSGILYVFVCRQCRLFASKAQGL